MCHESRKTLQQARYYTPIARYREKWFHWCLHSIRQEEHIRHRRAALERLPQGWAKPKVPQLPPKKEMRYETSYDLPELVITSVSLVKLVETSESELGAQVTNARKYTRLQTLSSSTFDMRNDRVALGLPNLECVALQLFHWDCPHFLPSEPGRTLHEAI